MMLAATVLPPEEQEHDFVCEDCEVSYSPVDYGVLLTNKKIAYFRLEQEGVPQEAMEGVPSVCLCHDCCYLLYTRFIRFSTLRGESTGIPLLQPALRRRRSP